jgi:hypothetical protein
MAGGRVGKDGGAGASEEFRACASSGSVSTPARAYGGAGSTRFVSALCRASLEIGVDGTATVSVQGVVTGACLPEFGRWMSEAALARSIGVVVDLREAVVGLNAEQLAARFDESSIDSPPLAVVVAADGEPAFRDWAWQRALQGAMRSVFRADEQARSWIRGRAALLRP